MSLQQAQVRLRRVAIFTREQAVIRLFQLRTQRSLAANFLTRASQRVSVPEERVGEGIRAYKAMYNDLAARLPCVRHAAAGRPLRGLEPGRRRAPDR